MKLFYNLFLGIVLLFVLGYLQTNAQTPNNAPETVEKLGCEFGNSKIDALSSRAKKVDERIFVVFRAGDKESEKMNIRRLQTTKRMLFEKNLWSKLEPTVIFAAGERAAGKARIEFYIGSKLSLVFLVEKDKFICTYCCDDPFEKKN